MSLNVKYGMINIRVEKDTLGFSFSCPLCHQVHFSTGDAEVVKRVVQDHLQQFHRITLPAAVITEDEHEAPKVQLQYPPAH